MSFSERLNSAVAPASQAALRAAESAYAEATFSLVQHQKVRGNAFEGVRHAAKAALNQLCRSEGIPIHERAAWSAAFHNQDSWRVTSAIAPLDDFVHQAEHYGSRLAEIDAQLKEPGAPILGFITGSAGDPRVDQRAMRYAYRVSDGSGLTCAQHYNDMQDSHYHTISAGERPLSGRVNTLDTIDTRRPLIYCADPGALIKAVIAPREAAEALHWESAEPTKFLVVGSHAVRAMFEAVGSNPRSDLLLGHAVHLGYRPEF